MSSRLDEPGRRCTGTHEWPKLEGLGSFRKHTQSPRSGTVPNTPRLPGSFASHEHPLFDGRAGRPGLPLSAARPRSDIAEVLRSIAQQETRTGASARGAVARVVQGASVERQAPTADASIEQVARPFEHRDPCLERTPNVLADAMPVLSRGRPASRKRRELRLDLRQGQPQPLRDQSKGEAANVRPHEAPLVAARTDRRHETPRFVVSDGRCGQSGAAGKLSYRQEGIFHCKTPQRTAFRE